MNITEAAAWQTVASFLAGHLDHCDELTRRDIATKCATLDTKAHAALGAGPHNNPDTWDKVLCTVTTEEPYFPVRAEAPSILANTPFRAENPASR